MKLRRIFRTTAVAVAVAAAPLVVSAAPASAAGAVTVKCQDIFPELGGTIVFTPSGGFMANCWEHLHDGTPGAEGVTTLFHCSERLPEFPPELLVGVQVITASGHVLSNCLVHFS